ncbi:MAG: ATP-binding protein [Phormidesmis sp.]
MNLTAVLRWLNDSVVSTIGQSLREPEIVVLAGTLRGLTYEQMSEESVYSTNYLMRDVAPKLWKQLSRVFRQPVSKTNLRVAIEVYVAANKAVASELATYGLSAQSILALSTDRASAPSDSDDTEGPNLDKYDLDNREAAQAIINYHPASNLGIWETATIPEWNTALKAGVHSKMPLLPTVMYGYEDELAQAEHWLREATAGEGHIRLIGIWGLSGVGKTLLAETLVYQVGEQFDGVIRRSLQAQPTPNDLSASILMEVGIVPHPTQASTQLMSLLSQRSILLVLEGIEAVLQPMELAGEYRAGYEAYRDFFQGVMSRRSCLIVTGIEPPAELVRQGRYGSSLGNEPVRSLTLCGISERAAVSLLRAESLGSTGHWLALVGRYRAQPLALKAASRVIREIFNGRVDQFLEQTSVLFTDVLRLLAPSFDRLSPAEKDVLSWLAVQEVALSLADFQRSLSLKPTELVSVLDSLNQRSLLHIQITQTAPTFSLPALVRAYALHQLIARFSRADENSVAERRLNPVINLSGVIAPSVHLSQWLQGSLDANWKALAQLFESARDPTVRLRNVYHLRNETFIKGYKSVRLSADVEAVLILAIHQETGTLYRACIQVQPTTGDRNLPESLTIKLLNSQQHVLATVSATPNDTFIQLPDIRGALIAESFEVELTSGHYRHTETFTI